MSGATTAVKQPETGRSFEVADAGVALLAISALAKSALEAATLIGQPAPIQLPQASGYTMFARIGLGRHANGAHTTLTIGMRASTVTTQLSPDAARTLAAQLIAAANAIDGGRDHLQA